MDIKRLSTDPLSYKHSWHGTHPAIKMCENVQAR